MALSLEERERLCEEEWVRALAREDFEHQRPSRRSSRMGNFEMLLALLGSMMAMCLFIHLFGQN